MVHLSPTPINTTGTDDWWINYTPHYSPACPSKQALSTTKCSGITLSNNQDSVTDSFVSPRPSLKPELDLISPNSTYNHPPVPQRHSTSISKFLKRPSTNKVNSKKTPSAGSVLTSRENLQKLQDKKRNQEKKDREKQEHQRARAEKAALKIKSTSNINSHV